MKDPQPPSPEASKALEEAHEARRHAEAALPDAAQLSRRIRAQMETNHFLDLIESIMEQAVR